MTYDDPVPYFYFLQVRGKRAWKWSGCHDNTRFGARYSRKFLDVRERAKDMISFTHLYNNEVGRKVRERVGVAGKYSPGFILS